MLFAIWFAATAHAQSHLEVQLDDGVLTDLFTDLAQLYAPCGETSTCPDGTAGCLVDHLEVSGPATLSTGAGEVLVTVPVTKHVMDCVGDPACTPTPMSSPSMMATLKVDYLDVNTDPEEEALWPFLCAEVIGLGIQECQPLPVQPYEIVPFGLWDVASDGNRLALRLGNIGDPWWGPFDNGVLAVPMNEPGTIFMGWEAFRAQADVQLAEALDDLPAGLSIDGAAVYTWSGNGGNGVLDMTVPWSFDPLASGDFHASTTITFDPTPAPCLSGGGTCTRLQLDIAASLDVNAGAGVLTPVDMAVVEAAAMGMAGIFDSPDANCIAHDDWNMTCWQEVQNLELTFPGPAGDTAELELQPTWMWADATGISLGGGADVDTPEQWVDLAGTSPEYGVFGSCSTAYAGWSDGYVYAMGHHERCEVDFDHSGYWYAPTLVSGEELGWDDATWSVEAAAQTSYPVGDHDLYATVVTTAGIRTTAVPIPVAPTYQEMQDAEYAALGKRLNCAQAYIPYVEIPWLEEMIAPIDPYLPATRDRLVQVYDAGGMALGIAAVAGLAFEHHDDGTAWVTGQLVADGGDETLISDFSFFAGEAGRGGAEAFEAELLEEGFVGRVMLPDELGEEPGLFVEVVLQEGADLETYWLEQFLQVEGVEEGREVDEGREVEDTREVDETREVVEETREVVEETREVVEETREVSSGPVRGG